jgi:hypothetical protein
MDFVPDELVIGFHPGSSPDELQDPVRLQAIAAADLQAGLVERIPGPDFGAGATYLLRFRPGTDLCIAMAIYRALPEVRFVEPNFTGGGVLRAR